MRLCLQLAVIVHFLLPCLSLVAQPLPYSKAIEHKLSEGVKFALPNARFGSRFSLGLVKHDRCVNTGILGFDRDSQEDMLVGVSIDGKLEVFPFCLLTDSISYLKDVGYTLGATTAILKGTHSSGVVLRWNIISPFAPASSLADTAHLLTQILPNYYFDFALEGLKGQAAEVFVGLRKVPYDEAKETAISWWRYFGTTDRLYFKSDYASSSALAFYTLDGAGKHFTTTGYHGLSAKVGEGENRLTLGYAAYTKHPYLTEKPSDMPLTAYYTKFWPSLDSVIRYARAHKSKIWAQSAAFEKAFDAGGADAQQRWLAALTFRADAMNAYLLKDRNEKVVFAVAEGRFRHLNTIDVAMEAEVLAMFNPWRLQIQLQQWANGVTFRERKVPSSIATGRSKYNTEGISAAELGPFLFHDIGNVPYIFNAEGYDFGPFMPIEQNTSFIILLYVYWKMTGNDAEVATHLSLAQVLAQTMKDRDYNGNGIADHGIGWTTFDVSDALKQSPDNNYLAFKQMAAYLCLAEMQQKVLKKPDTKAIEHKEVDDVDGNTTDGDAKARSLWAAIDNEPIRKKQAMIWLAEAELIKKNLQKSQRKDGTWPITGDKTFAGAEQKSVVLMDGLYWPLAFGMRSATIDGLKAPMKQHLDAAMLTSTKPYGILLSDGEPVTWFSKIMNVDGIAHFGLGGKTTTSQYAYEWNKNSDQAYQDGAYSATKAWPGNWSPRGAIALQYLFWGSPTIPTPLSNTYKWLGISTFIK